MTAADDEWGGAGEWWGGPPPPLVLLLRLLALLLLLAGLLLFLLLLLLLLDVVTAATMAAWIGRMRLRTETLESPPPSIGTQPPDESSRVITCALTRTNESFLFKINKSNELNVYMLTCPIHSLWPPQPETAGGEYVFFFSFYSGRCVCRPLQLCVWGGGRERRSRRLGTEVKTLRSYPKLHLSPPDVISGRRRFQPPPPHNYFLSLFTFFSSSYVFWFLQN